MKNINVVITLVSKSEKDLENKIKGFLRLFDDKEARLLRKVPNIPGSGIFKAEMGYTLEVGNIGKPKQ